MEYNNYIKEILKTLPDKPGVYLMKNISGEIIYVGKAISLKRRVRQYFSKTISDMKVLAMVSNIDDIEYILTNSEMEALMLENNLIKKNKPFYNILLRDDKSFPYIKVSTESFPRIMKTRNKFDKDGIFFGPYTDVMNMNAYLSDIHRFFKIRDCNRNIERSVANNERPCLNYHIGICSAPCANKISQQEYQKTVNYAVEFLKGNHEQVKEIYLEKMREAAQKMNFEEAAEYRDKIANLDKMKERQLVSLRRHDRAQHYISFGSDESRVMFTILVYENGNLINREYYDFETGIGEIDDLFTSFLIQFYTDNMDIPKEIFVDDSQIDIQIIEEIIQKESAVKTRIYQPKIGAKKEILALARKNAYEQLRLIELKKDKKEKYRSTAISELEKLTNVNSIKTIESYDVSNISGADSVGVKIVYKDGHKSPSDYRKYRISISGKPDDYASTAEMIERRIKKDDYPDIILLDGGKGHVSTIKEVLDRNNVQIPVFGMYKNEKHQTEGIADDKQLYEVNKNSNLYRLISEIQEEVHRFAINYHRKMREKSMITSELDHLPGIGEKRKLALLRAYGGIEGIKNATLEELCGIDAMNKASAKTVYEYFRK